MGRSFSSFLMEEASIEKTKKALMGESNGKAIIE